ncbi:MAG: hypothetical protein M1812_003855 [Candelaria pacifica]|nr:MAG: hypothetical protein M1812_003855 [Candelaria pacifica]
MAKSSRSSSKKANKSKLRSRVFRPVENARTERLSAKLLHLASQPKPTETDAMKIDVEHLDDKQHQEEEVNREGQTEGKHGNRWSLYAGDIDFEVFQIQSQAQIARTGTEEQAAGKGEGVHGLPKL